MIKVKSTFKEVSKMLLSSKVIKASRAASDTNKAIITTEYKRPQQIEDKEESTSTIEERHAAIERADEIIKEAEHKSQQLLKETKAEIAQTKALAQERGHQAGYQAAFRKGYDAGYNEGFDKAIAENKDMRERAVQMLHDTHEAIRMYQSECKDEFLELATHMAEKIVHDYIDQADDGILAIAKPFLYQLDKEEEFVTISVHPEKREQIEERLEEIKSISPGTRFMILGDPSLAQIGMLIESSHAVVDLQIRNQLDRMLEEFSEMERTVDA